MNNNLEIIKEFLLWFYENKTSKLKRESIKNKYKENTKKVLNIIEPYFKMTLKYISLKYTYGIGPIKIRDGYASIDLLFDDFPISSKDLKNALNNDIVLVRIGKRENYIVELILKHHLTHFVSEISLTNNEIKFLNSPFNQLIILDGPFKQKIEDGQVLYLKIDLVTDDFVYVSIKEVIGHKNDSNIDLFKLLYKYEWPLKVSNKAETLANKITFDINEDKYNRKDLTNDLIFTIDGSDAKDLDDAISFKKEDNHYMVSVHIADVSYFVKRDSLIDKEAYLKTTSLYLNDYVVPMLPEKLSNDLCSLNPNTNKYTITCEMAINNLGEVLSYDIYPSIINSKYRLTYDEVNNLLINNKSLGNKDLDNALKELNNLSIKITENRLNKGSIDFNSTELRFVKNDKGAVVNIIKRTSSLAEGLIENLMILANESVSKYLTNLKVPLIYRVHEKPDFDKVFYAIKDINKMGYQFENDYYNINIPKAMSMVLNTIENKTHLEIANYFLLRSMMKAKYDVKPIGHFGLRSSHYSHFTAPIRRYSDLLLHRIIRDSFNNKAANKNKLKEMANHLSEFEIKANTLERESVKLNSILYLNSKDKNLIYEGYIISFFSHGFFVKLDNGIEGFVSFISILNPTNYDFKTFSVYIKGYTTLKLGDKVRVKILSTNMESLKIDFSLIFESTYIKKIKKKKNKKIDMVK